jgi:hypothetical protein
MGERLVVGCLWLCGCSLFLGDGKSDPGADASSEISGGQILAFTPTRTAEQEFSIESHAFLRIGYQDGAVTFGASADGDDFSPIMTEPVDFSVGDVEIRLSAESTDAAILRISALRGDPP